MENNKFNSQNMATSTQDENIIRGNSEITDEKHEFDTAVYSGKEYFDYIRYIKNEENGLKSDYSSAFMTF